MELDDIYELRTVFGAFFISEESYNEIKNALPNLEGKEKFQTIHIKTNDGGDVDLILNCQTVILHSTKEIRQNYRDFIDKFQEEGQPETGFTPPQNRSRLVQ